MALQNQQWVFMSTLYLVILLLSIPHLPAEGATLLGSCSPSGTECAAKSEICVGGVCKCAEGYISEGTTCRLPLNNEPCLPDQTCGGNLQCDASQICCCSWNTFYNGSYCSPKIGHQQMCNSAQSTENVCAETNSACITALDGRQRCLCDKDHYRSDSGVCEHLDNLKVTSVLSTTRDTTQITLFWNVDNPDRADVIYTVKYNDGNNEVPANQTGGTISGLTPGTQYNFQIISSLPADTFYRPKAAVPVNASDVWTKPAKPGPVDDPVLDSQLNQTLFVYNVTFQESAGNVTSYTMEVSGHGIIETQTTSSNETRQPMQLQFYQMKPGQTYAYTVTAYNGNSPPDSSEFCLGLFTTKSIELESSDSIPLPLALGLGCGLLVLVVVVVTVVAMVVSSKRKKKEPETESDSGYINIID